MIIKKCSCNHDYQDELYGKGNRAHNVTSSKSGGIVYTCTVCKTKTTSI